MGPEAYLRFVARNQGGSLLGPRLYLKVQGLRLLYEIGVFSRVRAQKGLKGYG